MKDIIESINSLGSGIVLKTDEGEEVEYIPPPAKIKMNAVHKLDKYGFILNVDSNGRILEVIPIDPSDRRAPTAAEVQLTERRVKKWGLQLDNRDKRRTKKMIKRCRKGIPDSLRGQVWIYLGGGAQEPGLYEEIVQKASVAMLTYYKENADIQKSSVQTSPTASVSSDPVRDENEKSSEDHEKDSAEEYFESTKGFRLTQDTIERDIHRTFPRHNLFYESERPNQLPPPSEQDTVSSFHDPELAAMILDLEEDIKVATSGAAKVRVTSAGDASQTPCGQAALRRVLRVYSYYDRDVGYCQGMNFIVGMFLTLMNEEEAFWLLVGVMNRKPCAMRGLFGEGMKETHKVLYVADKLIGLHLPRLAKHFERENIQVTMYATQWLLTQYTSSFDFDLVMRVWDAFLGEGWKIIYRVMLALLYQWQGQLLRSGFEDILALFRDIPGRVDADTIMNLALKMRLTTKQIQKYEREWHLKNRKKRSNTN